MMTLTEPHIVCWSWACLYSPLPVNPFIIIIFIHSSNWSNLCDWHVDGTTHGSENTVITQSVKTPNANNSNRVSSTRYLAQASNLSPVHSPHLLLLLLSRPKTSRLLFSVCFSLHLQVSDLQVEAGSRIQPPPSGLPLCLHCPPSQVTTLEWISLILITLLFILICTCSRWDCKRHAWRSE